MAWNSNREAPFNFMAQLYGESDEEQLDDDEPELILEEELEEVPDDEDEIDLEPRSSSPVAPPYSPLTSPERRRDRSRSPMRRDRSRSPIRRSSLEALPSSNVVIRLYDETGMPLGDAVPPYFEDLESQEIFVNPDAHALFESAECMQVLYDDERIVDRGEVDVNMDSMIDEGGAIAGRSARARSVRGRVRGGRRVRVSGRGCSDRGRGGGRRQRGAATWQVGHPLEEIWVTDDDVPSELREMATDVIRRRQERAQVSAARNRSTRERIVAEGDESASEIEEDVFYDAGGGRDNSMLEGEDLHFEWSPMETFHGEEELFRPERTGSVSSYTKPYDAFRSYWDDGILQTIVDETNRYAAKISSAAFQSNWYETNSHEMLCLIAFWMITGIIRLPTICSYFSTNALLKTEIFSRITTLRMYNSLNRALHFVDTDPATDATYPTNSDAASFDRMHCLRPIIDRSNLVCLLYFESE